MRGFQAGAARGRAGLRTSRERGSWRPSRAALSEGGAAQEYPKTPGATAKQRTARDLACVVCEALNAKYRFVCCRRRFCGTLCYRTHKERGCSDGERKSNREAAPQQASSSGETAASATNISNPTAANDARRLPETEAESSLGDARAAVFGNARKEALGASSASSDSSEESGELTSSSESSEEEEEGAKTVRTRCESGGGEAAQKKGREEDAFEKDGVPQSQPLSTDEKRAARKFCLSHASTLKKLGARVRAVATAAALSHDEGIACLAVHLGDAEFERFSNDLMDAVLQHDVAEEENSLE